MPARTAAEAVRAYIDPLQKALSCISNEVFVNKGGYFPSPKPHLLTTGGEGRIALAGTSDLYLAIAQQYSVIQLEPGKHWKVRTDYYSYGIETGDGPEILAYHWHPTGISPVSYPHMHIKAGSGVKRPELKKSHIPTGRVSLEDLILYLIQAFEVPALRNDWASVLDETGSAFLRQKSW